MNPQAFINKVNWVRRRARRIQRFFCETRSNAVSAAALDWIDFNPIAPSAPRTCQQLGVCQSPARTCQGQCHQALLRLSQPQPLPTLAPGVLDGPYKPAKRRPGLGINKTQVAIIVAAVACLAATYALVAARI